MTTFEVLTDAASILARKPSIGMRRSLEVAALEPGERAEAWYALRKFLGEDLLAWELSHDIDQQIAALRAAAEAVP